MSKKIKKSFLLQIFSFIFLLIIFMKYDNVYADERIKCGSKVYATMENDGTVVVSGKGSMYNYNYDGRPFADDEKQVTSVIVEDGVTSVGEYVFAGFSNLTSVCLADSVTDIGDFAFADSAITDLTLGNNVENIGDHAFDGCWIESLELPSSVRSIGQCAFYDGQLRDIVINDGIEEIRKGAFSGQGTDCVNVMFISRDVSISVQAFDDKANITAYKGSTAEKYAKRNNNNLSYITCETLGEEHNFGEGEIVKKATCINNGLMRYTCAKCGKEKDEKIEKISHDFEISEVVEATCTDGGYTEYKCSVCGQVEKRNYTSPVEHKYILSKRVNPSCDQKGYDEYMCTVCNDINRKNYRQALGHCYKNVIDKAGIKKSGTNKVYCGRCKKIKEKRIIYGISKMCIPKTQYKYTGKKIKPAIVIKDSRGKNISKKYYTVNYKNNKRVGKATIVITFKGIYNGRMTKSFRIV